MTWGILILIVIIVNTVMSFIITEKTSNWIRGVDDTWKQDFFIVTCKVWAYELIILLIGGVIIAKWNVPL